MGTAFYILSYWIIITLRNVKQVIGRNLEIFTNCLYILDARLVFAAFEVGYLPLCHIQRFAKLGLIEVCVFSENSNFFSNR